MAIVGKIENLQLLYLKNEKSDKVWGHFRLTGYVVASDSVEETHVRFWGKRTATKFGISHIDPSDASDLEWQKQKSGYNYAGTGVSTSLGTPFEIETHERVNRTLDEMLQEGKIQVNGTTFLKVSPGPHHDKINPGVSAVTNEAMAEGEIKPSEVTKAIEFVNEHGNLRISFYNRHGTLLGTRDASQKTKIYDHLKITKTPRDITVSPGDPNSAIILWD